MSLSSWYTRLAPTRQKSIILSNSFCFLGGSHYHICLDGASTVAIQAQFKSEPLHIVGATNVPETEEYFKYSSGCIVQLKSCIPQFASEEKAQLYSNRTMWKYVFLQRLDFIQITLVPHLINPTACFSSNYFLRLWRSAEAVFFCSI